MEHSRKRTNPEANIQNVFETDFINSVFANWDKIHFETHNKNKVNESIIWQYSKDNSKTSVSVDISRKHPGKNEYFLFELKSNIALAFSQCGYILLSTQVYRQRLNATVHPYMVARHDTTDPRYNKGFEGKFPIYPRMKDEDKKEDDAVKYFQSATNLGLIILDMPNETIISRIHIIEAEIYAPLLKLATPLLMNGYSYEDASGKNSSSNPYGIFKHI